MLREEWVKLFADPALGERTYSMVFREGRNRFAFSTPAKEGDGSWTLRELRSRSRDGTLVPVVLARVTLVRTGADWRVTTFELRG